MTDTAKLREAIDFYRGMNCETTEPMQTVLAAAKLVLAAQIAESAVEAVADAINRARYHSPIAPNLRERGLADEDASSKEYAFRLARAALSAASLSGTVERGATEDLRFRCKEFYQKLSRDQMLRQGSPVDSICDFVASEIAFDATVRAALSSPGSAPQVKDGQIKNDPANYLTIGKVQDRLARERSASLPPSGAQVTRDELAEVLVEWCDDEEALISELFTLFGRRA